MGTFTSAPATPEELRKIIIQQDEQHDIEYDDNVYTSQYYENQEGVEPEAKGQEEEELHFEEREEPDAEGQEEELHFEEEEEPEAEEEEIQGDGLYVELPAEEREGEELCDKEIGQEASKEESEGHQAVYGEGHEMQEGSEVDQQQSEDCGDHKDSDKIIVN